MAFEELVENGLLLGEYFTVSEIALIVRTDYLCGEGSANAQTGYGYDLILVAPNTTRATLLRNSNQLSTPKQIHAGRASHNTVVLSSF